MPLPRENNRLGHRPRHHDRESLTQAELIILAGVHYIAQLVEKISEPTIEKLDVLASKLPA